MDRSSILSILSCIEHDQSVSFDVVSLNGHVSNNRSLESGLIPIISDQFQGLR